MALFVVRHQHAAECCPAHDPYMGAMLLNHLSSPNVRRHGVEIRGEAVVQGEHTLYFIAEADDEGCLREFMKPFQMVGSVNIYPASTCARVVASGGCGAAMPVSELVPALDPEEACQKAIEAGLVVHRAHPLNGETSIPALIGGVVMPNAHFYVRDHFQIPNLDPAAFRLAVGGLVERPLDLNPPIEGEKWDLGAVSTAEWTGVSLAEVLDRAGVRTGAREVLFRGADGGPVEGYSGPMRFERSLQIDHARDRDVLLAYAMNGEPLPIQHGFPLRLVVPGWYAVASVKWLTEIELIDQPFAGHFQATKYWYEWERDGQTVREPVTLQRVRALITEPAPDQEVRCGELAIRGLAWSGAAQIARVEISVGEGSWQEAHLVSERKRHSWQWWELITRAHEPGVATLRARATDLAGRTQPERAEWNRLGYGNNAIHEVPIRIV
jgi:DMSO/TMAO reductase YedYZ molybdopterin-dependent catalytic subunit